MPHAGIRDRLIAAFASLLSFLSIAGPLGPQAVFIARVSLAKPEAYKHVRK